MKYFERTHSEVQWVIKHLKLNFHVKIPVGKKTTKAAILISEVFARQRSTCIARDGLEVSTAAVHTGEQASCFSAQTSDVGGAS